VVVAVYLYSENPAGPMQDFGSVYNLLMTMKAGIQTESNIDGNAWRAANKADRGVCEIEKAGFGYSPQRRVRHDFNFVSGPGAERGAAVLLQAFR
jgi:hypothetical protein